MSLQLTVSTWQTLLDIENEQENTIKKEAIIQKVKSGVPIFGICLGLQLLFTESEEFGAGKGLDLISGVIKRFPELYQNRKIRVPQIAWNTIYNHNLDWRKTALKEIKNNEFMYFIHSYYAVPQDKNKILTQTNYDGVEFCSSVNYQNIFATQFHPEKSSDKGISIYKNWALIYKLI